MDSNQNKHMDCCICKLRAPCRRRRRVTDEDLKRYVKKRPLETLGRTKIYAVIVISNTTDYLKKSPVKRANHCLTHKRKSLCNNL